MCGDAEFVSTRWWYLSAKAAIDLIDDGPDTLTADRFWLTRGEHLRECCKRQGAERTREELISRQPPGSNDPVPERLVQPSPRFVTFYQTSQFRSIGAGTKQHRQADDSMALPLEQQDVVAMDSFWQMSVSAGLKLDVQEPR